MMSGPRLPRPAVMLFAAVAVTAAVYGNALQGPFIWDDVSLITAAPQVRRLDPRAHLGQTFWAEAPDRSADTYYYRPLTSWTYALDWARGDGSSGAFHATNVLIHLASTALVFLLARRMGAGPIAAAFGATLFGTFPRLTENVTWISGRTDVLASALALSALLMHGKRGATLRCHAGAAALLFLGLLSKEVAAAAACGIAALELASVRRGEKSIRAGLAALGPAAVACACYAVLRLHAQTGIHRTPTDAVPNHGLMPIQALGRYLLMLIDPRPRLQIGILGTVEPIPLVLGGLAALALVVGLFHAVRHPPPPLACGVIATAAVSLGLVLHLVVLRLEVLAADRFLYLPLGCLAPLLAAGSERLTPRVRRGALAAAALLLPVYALVTVARNEDWADEVRLWQAAAETTDPRNVIPVHELGNALLRKGRLEEALDAFRQALPRATGSRLPLVLANIASTLADLGRLDEAARTLAQVVVLEPGRPVNYYNLAIIEMRRLRFDEARSALDTALRLMPDYADALRASATIEELRTAAAGLPPERPDEPLEVRVRRARFWVRLTIPSRAIPLWDAALSDPTAPPLTIQEGAAYLVTHAGPEIAARAVERARSAGLPAAALETLEAARSDRFPAGTAGSR